MKFRYIGYEGEIHHPDLGMINWDTKVEPSDAAVAKALKKHPDFKEVPHWDHIVETKAAVLDSKVAALRAAERAKLPPEPWDLPSWDPQPFSDPSTPPSQTVFSLAQCVGRGDTWRMGRMHTLYRLGPAYEDGSRPAVKVDE